MAQSSDGILRTYMVHILYLDHLAHCHISGSSGCFCKLGHCEYSIRKQNMLLNKCIGSEKALKTVHLCL
jgi:hypothetical protein